MENEGAVLTDKELVMYLNEIQIVKLNRFKDTITQYTLSLEFVDERNSGNAGGNLEVIFYGIIAMRISA